MKRVRDRRERWRDSSVREERSERGRMSGRRCTTTRTDVDGSCSERLFRRRRCRPARPHNRSHATQQPLSSRPSISSSASSSSASQSTSASPTHHSNSASISKSNSHTSIASLFVSHCSRTFSSRLYLHPALHHIRLTHTTARLLTLPLSRWSPAHTSKMSCRWTTVPVIVELRRRNSSADAPPAAVSGRDDPLARYSDRMIVKERDRERVKRDDRESSRPSSNSRQAGKGGCGDSQSVLSRPSHHIQLPARFYPHTRPHTIVRHPFLRLLLSLPSKLSPTTARRTAAPMLAISRLSSATIEQKDLAVVELRCKDFRRLHVLFTGLTRKNQMVRLPAVL